MPFCQLETLMFHSQSDERPTPNVKLNSLSISVVHKLLVFRFVFQHFYLTFISVSRDLEGYFEKKVTG